MQSLPAPVKRRIKALKQLQLVTTNIEAKFYEEVHALECEYYKMCAPLYEKRNQIISGAYEPSDEQCVWESDEDEETLNNYMKDKAKIEDVTEEKKDEYVFMIDHIFIIILIHINIKIKLIVVCLDKRN
jgi:hypothetical protein